MDVSQFVSSLNGKAAYVYGLGKSGLASVEALVKSTATVIAWDGKEGQRNIAASLGAKIIDEHEVNFSDVGGVILSPGIPFTHPAPHPVVTKAQAAGIEVIGDIEVMGRCLPPHIKTVAITGTNGKSTTTALVGHILKECGMRVVIAGNIGTPVLGVELRDIDVLVLEMSSYQIDLCPTFRPDIGVLLNVTPDHLDRHGSMENYAAVKAKMIGPKTKGIISVDDPYCMAIFEQNKENCPIKLTLKEKIPFEVTTMATLAGAHNTQNALAAWHVCRELGLSEKDIIAAMKTFPGLAHRQQIVRKIGNITFINDSKATNAEAAAKALGTYDNIYWIVGGRAKEGGLSGLEEFMPRVTKAYLIGEAGWEFSRWLSKNNVAYSMSGDIAHALADAYNDANISKSVVLLSPACASWDQFKSFEQRGEVFIKLVEAIEKYSVKDAAADVLGNALFLILSSILD